MARFGLTGYIKLDSIDGESMRVDHEGEIDFNGIEWSVTQASSAMIGSGRTRARAQIDSLYIDREYDAASPYLALAAMQGRSMGEAVAMVRKDSGEDALDYLQITMSNVTISHYGIVNKGYLESDDSQEIIRERVGFSCERIKIKYIVQAEDHSAGDEHEVEYDIVAGS